MTFLLFPDTTVLTNFVIMDRVDLLAAIVQDRGRWTLTIAGECRRGAKIEGLGALAEMDAIFGTPIAPTVLERSDTALFRARLAKPGEPARQHLGEAETFAVITRRQLSAIFVTDDMDARALAASELEARTYGTADLVKLAVHVNRLALDAAWASIGLLRAEGRYVPGAPFNFAAFRSWCAP